MMTEAINPQDTMLCVSRVLPATPDQVFRAWTDPAEIKRWHHPGPDYETAFAEIDLRIGGRFRICMRHIEKGIDHVATGEYQEISPPQRLVYTWVWETGTGPEMGESLITVEFRDMGDSTELVLTHERLTNAEVRDSHKKGWTGTLENLAKVISTQKTGA